MFRLHVAAMASYAALINILDREFREIRKHLDWSREAGIEHARAEASDKTKTCVEGLDNTKLNMSWQTAPSEF